MKRVDGRLPDQIRRVRFQKDYLKHPISSVCVECGETKVICAVSMENNVPPWMRQQNVPGGWITCEYSMLPASTHDRSKREATRGKQSGRTMEIQRLIGRCLRSVVDLKIIGPRTFYIDCDVIDADGGTRCASITGAALALRLAFNKLLAQKKLEKDPMRELVAAVSVGMLRGEPVLDLCYYEDSTAEVDMNVIMTESGKFVEIQGCAEETPFSHDELLAMLDYARKGLSTLFSLQHKVINYRSDHGKNERRAPHPRRELGNLGDIIGDIKLENGKSDKTNGDS